MLRALDAGAGRAQHGPGAVLEVARQRLIASWSTSTSAKERAQLVRVGARVARSLGLRNVSPRLSPQTLRARLGDLVCTIKGQLAGGDEYATRAALGMLRSVLALHAEVRQLVEQAVRPGVDSEQWSVLMRSLVTRLWQTWDREVPGYRVQIFAAHRQQHERVRFGDSGFKGALLAQLREAASVLDAFLVASEMHRVGSPEKTIYAALGALAALDTIIKRGTRNAQPVPTADLLKRRIEEASQTVTQVLPETERYPLAQAMAIYQATLQMLDGTRRLVEENVVPGDTQAWTTALQKITREMWAFWDRRMPPYRLALFVAKDAKQTEVVMPDRGFKVAVIGVLGFVARALERLDDANRQKGSLNSETKLYKVLDAANRFIRGVGATVVDAAGGAVNAAGDAAKKVADGIGVGKALVIGAVVLGGGFVVLRALKD
ncbi:MAG: hypothetical protein IT370_21005 [Deltaproteobacteria bacterium]|nr:hypothetical protein [Deltaproteobacteria bacterium]